MKGLFWVALFLIPLISNFPLTADGLSEELASQLRSYCPHELKDGLKGEISTNGDLNIQIHNAHSYFEREDYNNAYLAINEAIDFVENDQIELILRVLKARIYYVKGLHQEAINEYRSVLVDFKTSKDSSGVGNRIISILGTILLHKERYAEGILEFKKLGDLLNGQSYDSLTLSAIHNTGLCYLHLKKFDSAEVYLRRSLKIEEINEDTVGQANSYMDLANLFYVQYKDNLAIPLFEKGLSYAKVSGNDEVLKNAYLNMAVVEENRNRYLHALDNRKMYEQLQKKLWNRDKIWELAKKAKHFELNLKEKEIAILNEKERAQKAELKSKNLERNTFLVASILLFTVTVIAIWAYRKIATTNQLVSKQKDELFESNNMKNQLFSIVAHDLKSPVFGLKRSQHRLELAMRKGDLSSMNKVVQEHKKTTDNTYRLLNNVLQWALEQTGHLNFTPESINTQVLINSVVYDYESHIMAKEIELVLDISPEQFIHVDLNSMKIVLRNLLDNALKFTLEHGIIIIGTKIQGESCIISIEDNGCGMSDEQLSIVFDVNSKKIQPDTEGQKGTGLGMVLCQKLVERNLGKTFIKSVIGQGTKIELELPALNIKY